MRLMNLLMKNSIRKDVCDEVRIMLFIIIFCYFLLQMLLMNFIAFGTTSVTLSG